MTSLFLSLSIRILISLSLPEAYFRVISSFILLAALNKRYKSKTNRTELTLLVTITRINPLNGNLTTWSNTLKQFVDNLLTNCLSMFDHFVGLALKGLMFF